MDNKVFKIIIDGTFAYFLIMYSSLIFFMELLYSPIGVRLLSSIGLCLLMILIGFFLSYRYKKALANNPDNESLAMSSSSVEVLGGAVTLIIILQLLMRQLIMTIVQFRPQTISWVMLLFLLIYIPYIVIAVVKIKKGRKIKEHKIFSQSIDFLCYHILLLYLLFSGIYQLMISLKGFFVTPDDNFTSFDFYWNFVPLGSVAAALVLYFTLLYMKKTIKTPDNVSCYVLTFQSYIIGGSLLFVISLFSLIDLLISSLTRQSFEFEFFQALIFLILSIVIIFYGKKRYSR